MFRSTPGLNRTAIAGALAVGMAITVSSFTMARAEHAKPDKSKIYSCSSGSACVTGSSSGSSTTGVEGDSLTANGVEGTTTATNGDSAVAGISSGTSGHANGVYGRSSNGPGLYASSTFLNGIEGHSSAQGGAGIAGFQLNTSTNSGNGVDAESADSTNSWVALLALASSYSTYIFTAYNDVTSDYCEIDNEANLTCSGNAEVKAVRTRHVNSSGQHVLAYAAESASATLDDVGTARMVGGVANVAIDRAFASTIDRSTPYHIFVTPRGDTRGLYVSVTTPAGFEVREAQGGRSTVSFDYRIVARPLDAKVDRLPLAQAVKIHGLRAR